MAHLSQGLSGVTISDCVLQKICFECYPTNKIDIGQTILAWLLYPPISPSMIVEKLVMG